MFSVIYLMPSRVQALQEALKFCESVARVQDQYFGKVSAAKSPQEGCLKGRAELILVIASATSFKSSYRD